MNAPKRKLECNCCGSDAGRWRQWWNRDNGFGMCFRCIQWVRSRGMPEDEIIDLYGREGINWGEPGSAEKAVDEAERMRDSLENR